MIFQSYPIHLPLVGWPNSPVFLVNSHLFRWFKAARPGPAPARDTAGDRGVPQGRLVPQARWMVFIREHLLKIDNLGVALF